MYSNNSNSVVRRLIESQPLFPSSSHNNKTVKRIILGRCSPQIFCMTSKPVILILLWTIFVGTLSFVAVNLAFVLLLFQLIMPLHINLSYPYVIMYSCVAILYTFYPLNGFIADVYCGRFRTITVSLSILCCSLSVCVVCFVLVSALSLSNAATSFMYALTGTSSFTAVIGIAGYGANFIQFGLDQLLDAPSHHQALFVHWAKWCYDLLFTFVLLIALFWISPCVYVSVFQFVIIPMLITFFIFWSIATYFYFL